MPSPLSVDLRERVVAAIRAGTSCREAAARFGVSVSSASRWAARQRRNGHVAPRPTGGDRHSHRMDAHKGLILAACRRKPAIFLRELHEHLAQRGVQSSTSGLSRFFARHGISRKKGRRLLPSSPKRFAFAVGTART